MKLDDLCNQIYLVAINEAKIKKHEYLTPEHFLYSTLMFDIGKEMFVRIGVDCKKINNDLVNYFKEYFLEETNKMPVESFDFIKMIEITKINFVLNNDTIVSVENIISAIFSLKESNAKHILNKNGVTIESFLKGTLDTTENSAKLIDKKNLDILNKWQKKINMTSL
jgi:ATP-dependent Clp protease ATP-binding subunit ClpA